MTGISGLAGAGMSAAASEVAQGNMSHGVVRSNMINMNKFDAALTSNQGTSNTWSDNHALTSNRTMQANTTDKNNYLRKQIFENSKKIINDFKDVDLAESLQYWQHKGLYGYTIISVYFPFCQTLLIICFY